MTSAARTLLDASRLPAFAALVRGGFVARGVTYGIVGALALALALGAGGGTGRATDQQGAMQVVADGSLGKAALIVVALGVLAYAVWKLIQAFAGRGPEGGGGTKPIDRVSNGGAGVSYLIFFGLAARVAVDGGGGGGGQQRAAAGVLGWPGGVVIVALAGAILAVVCMIQIKQAIAGEFLEQWKTEELKPRMRRAVVAIGRVGLVARAVVFLLIAYFLIKAAVQYNPAKAVGVDGALRALARDSPWLLGVAAAGLIVFAVYSFVEARYRRL